VRVYAVSGGASDIINVTFTNLSSAPSVSAVSLSEDGSGNLQYSFDTDEQLGSDPGDISVSVDGPNSGADWRTFDGDDFSETANGDGTYTYTLTTTQAYSDGDGTYTATVDDAIDPDGNNGGENGVGSRLSDTYDYSSDTTPPSISFAKADHRANGGDDDDVAFTVRSNDASGIQNVTFTATRSTNNDQYNQATVTANSNGNVIDYALDLGTDAGFSGANGVSVEIIVTDGAGNTRTCTGTIDNENGNINTVSGLDCTTTSTAALVPLGPQWSNDPPSPSGAPAALGAVGIVLLAGALARRSFPDAVTPSSSS
jgi:hypothetical protein